MLQTIKWLMTLNPGAARRAHKEDAIFGSIVGLLSYADLEFQREILLALLPPALFSDGLSVADVKLWPTVHGPDGTWIRPDAILDLNGVKSNITLVIEAKWDSDFSADQVKKQFHFLSSAEGRRKVHLLLVRDRLSAQTQVKQMQLGAEDVHTRTWTEILDGLAKFRLKSRTDRITRWAQDATEALEALGAKSFEGFSTDHLQYLQVNCGPILFFHRQFNWSSQFCRYKAGRRVFWMVNREDV